MSGIGFAPGSVLAALRSTTRNEILATFALGVVLFVYHIPAGLVDAELSITTGAIFVADQIKAFAILPVYVLVDRLTDPASDRRWWWVAAACAAAVVSSPLAVTWTSGIIDRFVHPAKPRPAFMAYIGLESAILGSAVLWIVADRSRARRARERMHRAELERIDAEKRSVESNLQALQARVEPRFLFSTLAQVKDLYERDTSRGERMLDELIAYLRAAMPQMRDTSSTVAREVDLARAYLAIVNVRLGDRLEIHVDCPPGADATRMSPMMLLPLVDLALAGHEASRGGGQSFGLSVEIDADEVRVTAKHHGNDWPQVASAEAVAGIRERLAALYAAGAELALGKDGRGGRDILLRFPAEPVESDPPSPS